jgi:hypothetical protein
MGELLCPECGSKNTVSVTGKKTKFLCKNEETFARAVIVAAVDNKGRQHRPTMRMLEPGYLFENIRHSLPVRFIVHVQIREWRDFTIGGQLPSTG